MSETTISLARRSAELGQKEQAQRAYHLVLQQTDGQHPEWEMEAASYIFFSEGDYQVAYTAFISLYNRGLYQAELMDLMLQAFYLPNMDRQRKQYQKNCERLHRYPYLFRKDFMAFEDLPILFFPFNDEGYVPFDKAANRFGNFVNFNHPVIDRYFFEDLENPILAKDVYSQYQLEYLNDTVRKSEWVGRENHIYLHYTDWDVFCAHLQCLDFTGLLRDRKQVFLIGDEIAQYPIDFKARFGIDYSKFPVRPFGIREINRLIWHMQLSAHNGGNFFNEIFHGHPNLLMLESVIFEDVIKEIAAIRERMKTPKCKNVPLAKALRELGTPTDKDILVAVFLASPSISDSTDKNSRIAPALYFQPHFRNIVYKLTIDEKSSATLLWSEQYEAIRNASIFAHFKYIKTFTAMRRPTTSYAATIRFALDPKKQRSKRFVMRDRLSDTIVNRSFMIDWQDNLFQDSVLVRFEDGKLNPKATFTAMAKFLDIPYTESMTYCSGQDGINPESIKGDARGFDTATVYRTYDEFANDDERMLIEYFLRDAYACYGYNFHYYQGEPVDEAWVRERVDNCTCIDGFIEKTLRNLLAWIAERKDEENGDEVQEVKQSSEADVQEIVSSHKENRFYTATLLLRGLNFINLQGQPLHMIKLLQLDPDLLEQPLYH